jgi:hypothetical protein
MQEQDEQFVVTALAAKYPIFARSTIRRWVANESHRYDTAAIQTFIPVLVQRSVDATLGELARAEGTSTDALTLAPTTDSFAPRKLSSSTR